MIALLGGTFDPPHFGHLLLAECARAQFGLSRVLFVPAGDPYRKTARQVTPAHHRLAMTELAIAGNSTFEADALELRRQGPSYTVDTLEALRARSEKHILLILGSDALADLPSWKKPHRIEELATIAVAAKGHSAAKIAALATEAALVRIPHIIDMPPLRISGTTIRARIARGQPVRYLLPDAVLDYINEHRLYLSPPTPSRGRKGA